VGAIARVDWYVDNRLEATTDRALHAWPVRRGRHTVRALVWPLDADQPVTTQTIGFLVK